MKKHYPRPTTEGRQAMCGKRRADFGVHFRWLFLGAKKHERCIACEVILRDTGSDVDVWILRHGGEL
jgi:hypothetical protein